MVHGSWSVVVQVTDLLTVGLDDYCVALVCLFCVWSLVSCICPRTIHTLICPLSEVGLSLDLPARGISDGMLHFATALWTVFKSYALSYARWILGPLFTNTKPSARDLDFTSIRYSQLWEDGRTLRKGLGVRDGEVVFSIAAAGDNALGLLLDNPSQVVAVDISPAQIALVSLKICAIQHLSYEEFTVLLGFRFDDVLITSGRPPAPDLTPRQIYHKLRPFLPAETREFWDSRETIIDSGIVHCGRVERMIVSTFGTCVRGIAHSKETILQLFEQSSLEEQQRFLRERWDKWLWRAVHRVVFSGIMLGRSRDASLVQDTSVRNISEYLLSRHTEHLSECKVSDNFFEEYMLLGSVSGKHGLPDYLKRENYALLRERVGRIQLLRVDMFMYLADVAKNGQRFDAFNLSDIFEWFSPEVGEELLRAILEVSNPGARLAYWNFLNYRHRPESLADRLVPQSELSAELHKTDRVWVYNDFVVEQVE